MGILSDDEGGLFLFDNGWALKGGSGKEFVPIVDRIGDKIPRHGRVGEPLTLDGRIEIMPILLSSFGSCRSLSGRLALTLKLMNSTSDSG